MWLDPVTLYAAKVAVVFATGSAVTVYGAVADSSTQVLSITSGVAVLSAGVWKLVSDHTAVENERQSFQKRVESLEHEANEWQAKYETTQERFHAYQMAVMRAVPEFRMAELHDLLDEDDP